jgi:CPA1 family monovalent cation:H+ antiporter
MNEIELVLALLVAVAALAPLARKLRAPYPIVLVIGGLILALLPFVPYIPLEPELAFLLFLPPLIYSAAYSTSIRVFRGLLRPILSLSVGLVLATTVVLAVVLHAIMPELGWPAAFVFGAIVSPPDAVAAAAVFRGLGVPRKIVTLLEGESLINDATALVIYRAALAAGATAFSAGGTALRFVVVGVGGLLVGLVVAVIIAWLLRRLDDPPVEITLSLLAPFAAYLPAEALGLSGVLATVAAGFYLAWWDPYFSRSDARVRGRAVWEMVDFTLNGLVFILIGLQLSTILRSLADRSLIGLVGLGLLLCLVAILVRLAWVFLDISLRWWLFGRVRSADRGSHGRQSLVVGWAGMRGVVSLAAALALPETIPERELLIFLTFVVILVTLVGQGLSLPWLIRVLGLGADGGAAAHQELHARRTAVEAAMAQIEQLRSEWPAHLPLLDSLQVQYAHRATHLDHRHEQNHADNHDGVESAEQELLEHYIIRRAVIGAERAAVLQLRQRGELDDAIWRLIERDLDLEELRMDA